MITATSLKHPAMQEKILNALIESNDAAQKVGHGRAYVANSKGNNIMRLDVFTPGQVSWMPNGGVIVYGDNSRQVTGMVETALGQKFCDLI